MKKASEIANELVTVDRQKVYGHPYDDFGRIAQMTRPIVEAVVSGKLDGKLGHALYMQCVKICRLIETPDHMDSIVDIHGYANTYEMVLEKMKECGEL